MTFARIAGVGSFLPEKVLTNKDLEKMMDTSDEWIRQRSGIEERRWVVEGQGGTELGSAAARLALGRAGLTPADVDCLIVATLSPDHFFPGTGVFIQRMLDIPAGV